MEKQYVGDLVIFRGLPGSGKTTLAENLFQYVCSADDFFIKDGEYKFDATKLHQAHKKCLEKCSYGMAIKVKKIAVANTNTTFKEFKKYIELAKEYNYRYSVVTVENYHGNESVHNVPDETISKMKKRFTTKL